MKFKLICSLLLIILLILVSINCWNFKKTSYTSDYTNILVENVRLTETYFETNLRYLTSGSSFRKFKYEIKNDALFITVYSGLVSKKFPNSEEYIRIEKDLNGVNLVYLKDDNNNRKLIYSKNS